MVVKKRLGGPEEAVVVEEAPVGTLFDGPRHPYTLGLFKSLPDIDAAHQDRLATIRGMVPSATQFPSGCRFRNRCDYAADGCAETMPELIAIGDRPGRSAACLRLDAVHADR